MVGSKGIKDEENQAHLWNFHNKSTIMFVSVCDYNWMYNEFSKDDV